jgi:hypothetical protein
MPSGDANYVTRNKLLQGKRVGTMSQRYHRGGTYQTSNPRAAASPLRSMPLLGRKAHQRENVR